MNIQYFFVYLPAYGWNVGTHLNMTVNWRASDDNKLTFLIQLNSSEVAWSGLPPVSVWRKNNTLRSIQMRPDKSGTCNLRSRRSSRS
jgi:hypothetical protein